MKMLRHFDVFVVRCLPEKIVQNAWCFKINVIPTHVNTMVYAERLKMANEHFVNVLRTNSRRHSVIVTAPRLIQLVKNTAPTRFVIKKENAFVHEVKCI